MEAMSRQSKSRSRWINSDRDFLNCLAKKLDDETGNQYLPTESKALLARCKGKLDLESLPTPTVKPVEALQRTTSQEEPPTEVDEITALFRSRFLLYENGIQSDLFPDLPQSDISLISPYAIDRIIDGLEAKQVHVASANTARNISEDDYDDAEDEETVEPNRDVNGEMEHNAAQQSTSKDEKTSQDNQEASEEATKHELALLEFQLASLYFTLEYDRHAMKEQNTLEASDRQVENDIGSEDREKLTAVNFGAANLSLKHLIAKIESSRDKLAMTDNELRILLSEVRKNRSKWANEEKIGQEELYEAAERVVIELRGYTEHSTAFLNKVTKREVPDYYNFIKNPMDLGTLMKNLKNIQYKSKAEFTHDVMLIWDNCLTYNADPAHPLRKHAYAMRRKSEQLLAMVPDVTIRDRSDVEAEEFGLEHGDQEDYEDEVDDKVYAGKSTRGTFGQKSAKSKKATGGPKVETNGDHEKLEDDKSTKDSQRAEEDVIEDESQRMGTVNDLDGSDDETDQMDSGFQIWRTRTTKARAKYAGARRRLFAQDVLHADAEARLPTPSSLLIDRPSEDLIEKFDEEGNKVPDDITLQEYEVCSLPRLATTTESDPPSDQAFSIKNLLAFQALPGGLSQAMQATALEMKNIRRLCTKLSTLKLMQDPTMNAFPASYFRQLMEADGPLRFNDLELEQEGYDVEPCGEVLARSLLTKSTSHILYQAGFEDFAVPALTGYTEIAGDFIQTLGKLMKQYTEKSDRFSPEEVLQHTLYEVGIPDLTVLEDYVNEDVYGKQDKVVNLHCRLKKFLNDFIHGTTDDDGLPNGQSLFDDNNDDAFVSGSLGDETGEDFFGFRELGLDKEFGMSSLSVPLRLLQGRLRPSTAGTVTADGDTSIMTRFDRKFPHITRELASNQIGIFRTYLDSKFEQLDPEDGEALIEDEELPIRQRKPKPRLGPTGKISKSLQQRNTNKQHQL